MGLLGLRKFIDACGCTRQLPVPDDEGVDAELSETHSATDRTNSDSAYETHHPDASNHPHHHHLTAEDAATAASDASRAISGSSSCSSSSPQAVVVAHVLVDMNCIVHSCFSKADWAQRTKQELIHAILARVRCLLTRVVVPYKSLTFCFDGPAPVAKLQTQRMRRRRVGLLDAAVAGQQLSALAITAGSLFMVELENALAAALKLHHGRGFLLRRCPVFLHGSTVPGEGEAKIARALAFLSSVTPSSAPACEAENTTSSSPAYYAPPSAYYYYSSSCASSSSSYSHAHAAMAHGGGGYSNLYTSPYNPHDSICVIGNDIDLVLTCMGATMYHNLTLLAPSSQQIIVVTDLLHHWLRTHLAGDGAASLQRLPAVRLDFIFLFLLNGGDHYTGAGEVASAMWRRYHSRRTAQPCTRSQASNDRLLHASAASSLGASVSTARTPHTAAAPVTLLRSDLRAVNMTVLYDLLDAEQYSGHAEPEVGVQLLRAALWSLVTVVTGVCLNYQYDPQRCMAGAAGGASGADAQQAHAGASGSTEAVCAPHVNHLRAAAQRYRGTFIELEPGEHALLPMMPCSSASSSVHDNTSMHGLDKGTHVRHSTHTGHTHNHRHKRDMHNHAKMSHDRCASTGVKVCPAGAEAAVLAHPRMAPLSPLETFVALMPHEAALPSAVAAVLRLDAYRTLAATLLGGNYRSNSDMSLIAAAAREAVALAADSLTRSECHLRRCTTAVQLNVLPPPPRRPSRYEQHRQQYRQQHQQKQQHGGNNTTHNQQPYDRKKWCARSAADSLSASSSASSVSHTHTAALMAVVWPLMMPARVPCYAECAYPPDTAFLDFTTPFGARGEQGESHSAHDRSNGSTTNRRTKTSKTSTAAAAAAAKAAVERRRVYVHVGQTCARDAAEKDSDRNRNTGKGGGRCDGHTRQYDRHGYALPARDSCPSSTLSNRRTTGVDVHRDSGKGVLNKDTCAWHVYAGKRVRPSVKKGMDDTNGGGCARKTRRKEGEEREKEEKEEDHVGVVGHWLCRTERRAFARELEAFLGEDDDDAAAVARALVTCGGGGGSDVEVLANAKRVNATTASENKINKKSKSKTKR